MFLTVAIINIVALILLSSAIADVIKSYIKKKKLWKMVRGNLIVGLAKKNQSGMIWNETLLPCDSDVFILFKIQSSIL
jgi:hypothetical protein